MVARLLRQVLCDGCMAENVEVEATWSYPIRIGDASWDADLCADHVGELIEPLTQALSGAAPAPVEAEGEPRHPCPLCDRTYKQRGGLQWHMSKEHPDEKLPKVQTRTRPIPPVALCPICQKPCQGGLGVASHTRFNHPKEWAAMAHPKAKETLASKRQGQRIEDRIGDGV